MRYYGTSLAIVSLVLLGLANSYLTTGLKPIDLTRNSYFLPYEINVDEEYRLSMEKFQPVFLKFRKDQLLPNQAYILSVSYPGYVNLNHFHKVKVCNKVPYLLG